MLTRKLINDLDVLSIALCTYLLFHSQKTWLSLKLCLYVAHNINNAAYIDYGQEPPPAATTVIQPPNRMPGYSQKDYVYQSKQDAIKQACLPSTCSNKGVCYEGYQNEIVNYAYLRDEYSDEVEDDSKWMVASLTPVCDCDLTSYTGSTCDEGKWTNASLISSWLLNEDVEHHAVLEPHDINVN